MSKAQNSNYTIDLLKKQRDIIIIILAILLLIILLLSIKVVSSSDKQIIIPTLSPEKTMIYDSKHISNEYYVELGLDILHLFLDISPDTISSQYKRLQMHFLPEARQNLVLTLREIHDFLCKSNN